MKEDGIGGSRISGGRWIKITGGTEKRGTCKEDGSEDKRLEKGREGM